MSLFEPAPAEARAPIKGGTFIASKSIRAARKKLLDTRAQRKFDRFLATLKTDAAKEDDFAEALTDWAKERADAQRLVAFCEAKTLLPIATAENFEQLKELKADLADIDSQKPQRPVHSDLGVAEGFNRRESWKLELIAPDFELIQWLVDINPTRLTPVSEFEDGAAEFESDVATLEKSLRKTRERIRDISEEIRPLATGPVYLSKQESDQIIVDEVKRL